MNNFFLLLWLIHQVFDVFWIDNGNIMEVEKSKQTRDEFRGKIKLLLSAHNFQLLWAVSALVSLAHQESPAFMWKEDDGVRQYILCTWALLLWENNCYVVIFWVVQLHSFMYHICMHAYTHVNRRVLFDCNGDLEKYRFCAGKKVQRKQNYNNEMTCNEQEKMMETRAARFPFEKSAFVPGKEKCFPSIHSSM